MSELKEYHSSFTGQEVDELLTKVKDGSVTADIEKELANKADKNGRYPEMSVGFADDLVGRGESVPAEFSFRASGGKSIKDGAARIKRLKGNSVVWNQKAQPLMLSNYELFDHSATEDNGFHINTLVANAIKGLLQAKSPLPFLSHKWLAYADIRSDAELMIKGMATTGFIANSKCRIYTFYTATNNNEWYWGINYNDNVPTSVDIYSFCIIDLTKMFGAGNEPTTIEEFYARKPIVEDEYAYNEGEVIHMTAEGIKSVGDNAWDEEWENGSFDLTTGDKVSSDGFIRSSNKIKVIPNESYYISRAHPQMYAWLYDNNGNYINYVSLNSSIRTFNFGPNVHYINFRIGSTIEPVITYNNDIMITLVHSGWKQDTDAGYQPYWEDRLIFDQRIKDEFPDGMSKWDMVYNKNGKGYIVKGTGVADLGQAEVSYSRTERLFNFKPTGIMLPSTYVERMSGILCPRYSISDSASTATMPDKTILRFSNGYIYIKDSSYTDVESFKADMAGVMLYYELAEPTIIEYDEPFNLDYRVADFGTEQAITEQPSAPISADIIYQFNAVDMIREHELEIAELQRIIATMQAQLTSLTSNNNN